MKNRKKLLGVIALMLSALFFFGACAGSETPESKASETGSEQAQTTDKESEPVTQSASGDASSTPAQSTTEEQTPTETPSEPASETPTEQPTSEEPTPTLSGEPTETVTSEPEAVTGVTLDRNKLTVKEGGTAKLQATVLPENAGNRKVTWTSLDPSIATVSNGTVTGVKHGVTTITVKTEESGFEASCEVTVSSSSITVTGIYFEEDVVTVEQFETANLILHYTPEDAYTDVSYYCYDHDVAVVNSAGKITAKAPGSTSVLAMAEVKGTYLYAECIVTVIPAEIHVSGIVVRTTQLDIRIGQSAAPKITILPGNASNKNLILESSNPTVVGVQNGAVIGITEGTATITVTTEDGGYTGTFTVKVIGASEPMDLLDYSSAEQIRDTNGYQDGIRKKTTGEILFSPNLPELRNMPGFNDHYENYLAYLRFSYADSVDDEGGYIFPSFSLEPKKSKGDWVDFFLQGDGIDCGFCPVAGSTYNINFALVNKNDPDKVVLYGTYVFTASEEIAESQYYKPTYGPGREPGQVYIQYVASGHGKIEGETKQLVTAASPSTKVVAVPDEGFVFMRWSDGLKTPERSGDFADFDTKFTAYFTADASNTGIPSMYIYTDSGKPVRTKNYETATMTIEGASDEKYNFEGATLQIRGRGNSSWNGGAGQNEYDSKNSYRVKFDEKIKLLGIGSGKDKDWVLNSNKFDLSGLRNFLVWTLANKMGTLPYVPSCTWVQLYINDQYRGMYMVTELVETGKDRVDVDDKIAGTDKGFLLEFDFRGHGDDEPYFYMPGYDEREVEICIKSDLTVVGTDPWGKEQYDQNEINAIKEFMLKVNTAIFSGKREEIDKYVDISSLIDMYIIEELSKDCDVGRASFFVQKQAGPDEKLYFTAPWDFDFGFGTYGPAQSYWGLVSHGSEVCPWYCSLVERAWFREEVVARMNELQGALEETLAQLDQKAAELSKAADSNAYFWNMYGRSYHQYVGGQVSRSLHSYDEHIEFIKDWTLNRWDILKDILTDYDEYY